MKLFNSFFSKDMAMDLGTANTLVYVKGEGIVLNEPSVIAYDTTTDEILAIGQEEAKNYIGRTPQNIKAVRPLKDEIIADFFETQAMIREFFLKIQKMGSFFKPHVVICVPTGITQVEKKAVIEAAEEVGVGKVNLIEEPMAAAIGANLDISQNKGQMIIDIGGGTTEVAIINLSSIAYSESVRVAGDEINEALIAYLLNDHQVHIGENTAEKCKIEAGSAFETPTLSDPYIFTGKDALTSHPKEVILTVEEIRKAISEPVMAVVEAVRRALEKTPPELLKEVYKEGIHMAGGGALLHGLDKLIENVTQIPCKLTRDPLTTVVEGSGITLENVKEYRSVFIN